MTWQGQNKTQDLLPSRRIPEGVQPWDYWRISSTGGEGLTGVVYGVCVPVSKDGTLPGFKIATLSLHTIRENTDGTITIKPNDGGSNSIVVPGTDFHGYIDRGTWYE